MELSQTIFDDGIVLALTGRLDLAAAPRVQRALFKLLSERPPVIVCDLSGVEEIDPVCAGLFTAVRHPALSAAETRLLLCAARPAVVEALKNFGVPRLLPLHQTLEQALRAAREESVDLWEQFWLAPGPTVSRRARAFVRRVCGRWGLEELAESAELLAGELVVNAMRDFQAPVELRLELWDGRLRIAVHDQDPRLLRVLAPEEEEEEDGAALSLLIVREVAAAWGVRRHPPGGKLVWCTLEPSSTLHRGRSLPATGLAIGQVRTQGAGNRPP